MEKMLNLVLFGPPGAGKGTQSENIINKYGLVHLSTGDILRTEIARGTDLGLKAKQVMDRGELVSDDIVIAMIETKLDANPNAKGFIFDGFPRTANQAVALDDLLQKKGTGISAMIALEVNDEELVKRLLNRGKDSGRADDSNEETIRKRITVYNNETRPLKNYYNEQGKFHAIQGIGSIDQIFKSIVDRLIFLNAEMELTALESDLEHLDLTIQDFEVANDIAPELLLEIDAVKRAEAEELSDARSLKRANKTKVVAKKTVNGSTPLTAKKLVKKSAPKKVAKKVVAKKIVKPSTRSAAKAIAKKKVVSKKIIKKAVAKKVVKKALKKTTPKKLVKKSVKKIAPKKVIKKASPKKLIKKSAPKTSKNSVKKAIKKNISKKVISKKNNKKKK